MAKTPNDGRKLGPDPTTSTRDFDYMPSQLGRRRHSFSLLSGSKVQPFQVIPSFPIKSNASGARKKAFDLSGETTPRNRTPRGQKRHSHLSSAPASDREPPSPIPPSISNTPKPAHSQSSSPTTPIESASPAPTSAPAPASAPAASPGPTIEEERFAYRCQRALRLATAALLSIERQESFIKTRIREEELTLDVLHDEAEYTRARKKTALYQVESIREMGGEYGVELPDQEDIKAELERDSPEVPHSPKTPPTKTPPQKSFADVLMEELDRTPSSSASELSPLSYESSTRLQTHIQKPQSPALEALNDLPPPTPSGQTSSQPTPSIVPSPLKEPISALSLRK